MKVDEKIELFLDKWIKKLEDKYSHLTLKELALAQAVKLGEEVGELCNEILHAYSAQRESKKADGKLAHEIGDVLLATMLLAKRFDIDPKKAILDKIDEIEGRE